jgi:hypothetical protein
MKHDLQAGFFADKLPEGAFAARYRHKVTLADDLKAGAFPVS